MSRDEDETYKAGEIKAGTLKIGKATINSSNVKVPAATAIRKGDALSLSQLEGGQVKVEDNLVIGSFSWTTPAAPIDKAGLQSIKFTPQDANYEMADNVNLTASVTLLDVPVRTMTLISVNTGFRKYHGCHRRKLGFRSESTRGNPTHDQREIRNDHGSESR